jgi:hypothetical protein
VERLGIQIAYSAVAILSHMSAFLPLFAIAAPQPTDAAVVSRAVILFGVLLIAFSILLVGIALLNRSRKLRRAHTAAESKRAADAAAQQIDPWRESAKRLID